MKVKNSTAWWTLVAIMACCMWGISGIFAKELFNIDSHISAIWLTQVRMIIAGAILLVVGKIRGEKNLEIWHHKSDAGRLVFYSILGLIPVQFCYFMAIQEGNASIATVLQFLGLFFVLFYDTFVRHNPLRPLDIICALAAFLGVAVIATDGHFNQLAVTPAVLLWGLGSAFGAATNMLSPGPLTRKYSSFQVTGWGLVVAGLVLLVCHPVFTPVKLTWTSALLIGAVILIGTLLPFQMLNIALRHITATRANMMDAFEPISATLGSVLFLGLHMSVAEMVGSVLVVVAVMALNYHPKKSQPAK